MAPSEMDPAPFRSCVLRRVKIKGGHDGGPAASGRSGPQFAWSVSLAGRASRALGLFFSPNNFCVNWFFFLTHIHNIRTLSYMLRRITVWLDAGSLKKLAALA